MASVRDLVYLRLVNGRVMNYSPARPAGDDRGVGAVEYRAVPLLALRHALDLAGGDISRLRLDADGSVFVSNTGRAYRGGFKR